MPLTFNAQLFLFDYFSAELTGRPADRASLFFKLGEMFLVPNSTLQQLFAVVNVPQIAAIDSKSGSGLYFRTKSYLTTTGGTLPDTSIDEPATIKSSVISAFDKLKCVVSPDRTTAEIISALRYAAECEHVHAMRTLGLLQAAGIIPSRDGEGLERLRRVGRWNDLPSLFMLMHYDGAKHLGALAFAASSLAHDLTAAIEHKYGKAPEPDESRRVLESMFNSGTLDRAIYSPVHADVVYSPVLDTKSKRNIVLSTGSAFESLVGDLPLNLAHGAPLNYDTRTLDGMPFKRESELDAVRRWLYNSDLRGDNYRPLGLCSDSLYMLDRYAVALHGCLSDANVVRINVCDTEECYFFPTKNNIFLRSCRDDKPNVFLLYVCGDPGSRLDRIKAFLRADGRARFMLDSPSVTLDLGDVLPVCFCDCANAARLAPLCDTVYIADAAHEEKLAVIDDILSERRDAYGLKSVSLAKGATDRLCELSVDEIDYVLDKTLRSKRKKGGKITLSADDFKREQSDVSIKFGFGFGG